MLVTISAALVVCEFLCVSVMQVYAGDATIDATLINNYVHEDLNGAKNGAIIERTQNVKINGSDVDTLDGFFNGIFSKVFKSLSTGSIGLHPEDKPGSRISSTNAMSFTVNHYGCSPSDFKEEISKSRASRHRGRLCFCLIISLLPILFLSDVYRKPR